MAAGFSDFLALTGVLPGARSGVPVAVPDSAFFVNDFKVERNPAALAITVSWTPPEHSFQVTSIRLVRRLLGYPRDQNDGTVVYEGAPLATSFFADEAIEAGTVYYYQMFSLHNVRGWLTSNALRGSAIAVVSGFFARKMFSLFDESYVIADKRLQQGKIEQVALEKATDPETGYVYNQEEDGATLKGPLRRFMKIFGAELDLVKGLIEAIPGQRDVDTVHIDYLPDLAAILGTEVNRQLDPLLQREDVKRTVAGYKVRGTIKGMIAKVRALSGLEAEIREDSAHVLCSNDPDRTSPDVTPIEGAFYDLPADQLFYSSDDELLSWLTFAIYVHLPAGAGLDDAVVQKLCETVPDFTPICRKGRLKFLVGARAYAIEDFAGDTLDGGLVGVRDELEDFAGDSLVQQVTLAGSTSWLVTNIEASASDLTNDQTRFTATAL